MRKPVAERKLLKRIREVLAFQKSDTRTKEQIMADSIAFVMDTRIGGH